MTQNPRYRQLCLANVRSLRKQINEVSAAARYMFESRENCLLCFTATWLNESVSNDSLEINGFGLPIRLDRDALKTRKTIGGGVCKYINERWCNNYVVRESLCTEDIELLSISVRPYYLPREFGQVSITVVYIPPDSNEKNAAETIHNVVNKLDALSADAPKLILGDFNKCNLKKVLPTFHQYVDCDTRKNKTIDLCYGNIKRAYKAVAKPPIGTSDHNAVHLIPAYKQTLKIQKPTEKTVKVWTEEALDQLKGCFECTQWETFEQTDNLDEFSTVVTDYINYCVDTIIPVKQIKIFPNNKPWITKEMKSVLNEKKRAFRNGDRIEVKVIQKKIAEYSKECKDRYKEKIEKQFSDNNTRQAWKGVKTLLGTNTKRQGINVPDCQAFAENLNVFYTRFDNCDFSKERECVYESLPEGEHISITEESVISAFSNINMRRAGGPDNIMGVVLKECRYQLCCVFQNMYQMSIDLHRIPSIWKTSNIVPVPKKQNPTVNNDYRPVALTSIAMKCFERIIKTRLVAEISDVLDPLQFAYRTRRGVEDATITLLHNIYKHLEMADSYVRILFVDFSSAFNTIQPHLLMTKLKNMDVNPNIIKWLKSFLVDRSQFVSVNGVKSSVLHTSTGAPQGCVLSPVLFILYTNDCRSLVNNCFTVKFADDAALAGLLRDSELLYRCDIQNFIKWCQDNYLFLNVKKTKEMIIDFRRNRPALDPIVIDNQNIEIVTEYKYLGTIIDHKLTWNSNTEHTYL